MRTQRLVSTDGFVVFDLDEAPAAAGIVRLAPKILPSGASELARSLTYAFASFGMQRSGASAGLNSPAEGRAAAVAAAVGEFLPDVAAGRLALTPGKGVSAADLAPLLDAAGLIWLQAPVGPDTLADRLTAAGVIAAADAAVGSLDGRTVAIEGFGETGPALVELATSRGALVTAVASGPGAAQRDSGFSAVEVRAAWEAGGAEGFAANLAGGEVLKAGAVFSSGAAVLLVGSKMGAVDHRLAEGLEVTALVPHAPLPYTTKALVMLERAGTVVVPDFLATAAALLAEAPGDPSTTEATIAAAAERVGAAVTAAMGGEGGCFLAACRTAEAFLSTWQDHLPFGRPLAA